MNKTGCGKTKGCYSLPFACNGSADCNYLFTYQVSGVNVVIELSAKNRWVAVAFNEKQAMVSVCYDSKDHSCSSYSGLFQMTNTFFNKGLQRRHIHRTLTNSFFSRHELVKHLSMVFFGLYVSVVYVTKNMSNFCTSVPLILKKSLICTLNGANVLKLD